MCISIHGIVAGSDTFIGTRSGYFGLQDMSKSGQGSHDGLFADALGTNFFSQKVLGTSRRGLDLSFFTLRKSLAAVRSVVVGITVFFLATM